MWNPNEKMSNEEYEKISTRIIIRELKRQENLGETISYRYSEKENYAIVDNRGSEDDFWRLSIEFDSWADFGLALEELESTNPLQHIEWDYFLPFQDPDSLDFGFPYTIFRSENGPMTMSFFWESVASLQRASQHKEMQADQIRYLESLEDN